MKPLISIGLPIYNGENYLSYALEAIAKQTYDSYELIISDNHSSDNTVEICKHFAKNDSRIKLILNKKNIGAQKNYNNVFNHSKGEYFKWASHDDICAPTFLEECCDVLYQESSVVLSYPRTVIINQDGDMVRDYLDRCNLKSTRPSERFRRFHMRGSGECNAIFGLIRKSVLEKTDLIGNYPSSDSVLLANLCLLGQFHEISERLFYRRDHPTTSIRANKTAGDVAQWFDPQRKRYLGLVQCRLIHENMKIIMRTNITAFEKFYCFVQILRMVKWVRKRLAGEFFIAMRYLIKHYFRVSKL